MNTKKGDMMQKFKKGDYVKIKGDYSSGFMCERGECKPMPNDYAGKEGIVIASNGGDYTLHVKGQGEVAWFPGTALMLIELGRIDKLKEWENTAETERKEKSNIDWIFSHGKEVLEEPHEASISTLAKCFGLTNLWGSHGEGFVYFQNAQQTLALASFFLDKGDKEGWLKRCDVIRCER
jgi:hypothetical protein